MRFKRLLPGNTVTDVEVNTEQVLWVQRSLVHGEVKGDRTTVFMAVGPTLEIGERFEDVIGLLEGRLTRSDG